MNAKSVLWTALGVVLGLMTMILVIVMPAVDDPCEGGSVVDPSGSVPPGGDPRAAGDIPSATANPAATATPALAADAGPLDRTWPMAAGTFSVSDVFGSRGGGHKGIDLAAPDGTPIFSVTDGVVVAAGPASGFGNWIVVDSTDPRNGRAFSAVYGHMWDHGVLVRVGEQVRAGQHIGSVGSAGESSGPHLHFEVVPGGRFTGGRQIDPVPWLDGAPTPDLGGARAYSTDPECVRGFGTPGGALADGKVPPELEIWYRRAGSLCPEVTPSLLAAQGRQESGFRRGLTSPAGAQGLAQFLPGTATSTNPDDGQPYVIDADGNGVASVWDDGDAIMGQGRYMCAIAHKINGWMAEGRVHGDVVALTLAAYNAGEGAVLASGGMPNQVAAHYSETQPYVTNILAMEAEYRAPGASGRFAPDTDAAAGDEIVRAAHEWLGTPYVWGGGGPQGPSSGGLDGPGLTSAAVFAASGGEVSLPRTAEQQWEAGTEVSIGEIRPGDLVFSEFAARGPARVGIYAGNGQMIHAAPAVTADAAGGVAEAPVPGDARARRVL
ncbi:peptidoglycan DD-metalloendopeptidase family protein [Nocardia flavorosea]|uniref:Peptidoglycan DD-metalloendopeptidase family protein n=1 Tax=Nocardia flavorosea TaxID=53429 RepID=A0A846YP65_9NOCA|nr:peptidoglycan DD-metalloendopeptidase family protein [Nocardia flavorosea]NKY59324.1 peptidoglycan DD-metalloendopeptidase family protein [Nocardia flavorosea]